MNRFGKAKGDRLIPYQFSVPETVHGKVMERFKGSGMQLAPFMRMYFTKLGTIDLDRLIESLEKFHKRQQRGKKNRRGR